MAYNQVGTAVVGSSAATFSAGPYDTTGADLIVIGYSYLAEPTITDSSSNTWHTLTAEVNGGATTCRLAYATAHDGGFAVNSSHVFTFTQASLLGAAVVQGYSGSLTSADPFDAEDGNGASGTSIDIDNITPSENNCLVVTVASGGSVDDTTDAVDGGFTIRGDRPHVGGTSFGVMMADLIQTTAAAAGPVWSQSGTQDWCGRIASFKAAAAAGGAVATRFGFTLMGIQ